jgi:hypothetical protein
MTHRDAYAACPRLDGSDHEDTSPRDFNYNCIAHAAGDSRRWWWPSPKGGRRLPPAPKTLYWPPGLRLGDYSLESFKAAFATLGYRAVPDGALEDGVQKVALYGRDGIVSHAARQLENGHWTSKLGRLEDIRHVDPSAVADGKYGEVLAFLGRDRTLSRGPRPTSRDPTIRPKGERRRRRH